jgi:hypothetical protein
MKKNVIIIFIVVAIAVSGIIYGFTYKSSNSDNEKVMTDEETERSQPVKDLTVVDKTSPYLVFREDTNNNLETERSQPVKDLTKTKRSQPVKDLTVREVCVTNMVDEKSWSIHGLIVNSSTDSTFKEVVVEITYYSEDETSLGSKTYTIPEIFSPQSKKDVALNIEPNKGDVRRIGMNVINATAHL